MTVAREALSDAIDRIVTSRDFPGGERMAALLTYLVEKSRLPGGRKVSGFEIGIDILGRGADFDPNSDAIVRVYVGRLRKALTLYYATEGRDDPVRIDIPKGGYDVVITAAEPVPGMAEAPAPAPLPPNMPKAGPRLEIPSVAILPFLTSGTHSDAEDVAHEMADEIARKLSVVRLSKIFEPLALDIGDTPPTARQVHEQTGAAYVVMGRLRFLRSGVRAVFRLIDCRDDFRMIWTFDYQLPAEAEALFDALEETTDLIQAEIRLAILEKIKTDFEASTPVIDTDAGLLLHALPTTNNQSVTLDDYYALEVLARRVLTRTPTALSQVVLGTTMAFMAICDPISDTQARREEAAALLQSALDQAPRSTSVLYCAFVAYQHLGAHERLPGLIQRILEIDPWHPGAMLLNYVINPTLGPSAPREKLAWLVAKDQRLSRASPARGISTSLIAQGFISIGDFQTALHFAQKTVDWFRNPLSVYRLAKCLMRVGRPDAAMAELERLQLAWPSLDPDHFANVAHPRQAMSTSQDDPGRLSIRQLADMWRETHPVNG